MYTPDVTIPRISITSNARGYSADFVSHPEATRIFELFSTYSLPLPFTADADVTDVVADVLRRFPNTIVTVR